MPARKTSRNLLVVLILLACIAPVHALTPGPTVIRQCPGCTNVLREFTIGSGNLFGATWWTDGKQDAPGLPMRPELGKCPHCGTLFWIAEATKLAVISWTEDRAKWSKVVSVEDPLEKDYLTAASAKGISEEHELSARKRAWWLANDTIRDRAKRSLNWSGARRENLEKLSALLSDKEECEVILKAEIARELEQFEQCTKLLARTLKEKDCESYAAFVRRLAQEKKSKVARLPSDAKSEPKGKGLPSK
jgi:hypothetical protein